MKKCNIGILGTIGVGKTTLLEHIRDDLLKYSKNVEIKAEPSVTIPFINDVLQKFYKDNKAWSFVLQLCISAAQEAYFQDLREADYEYAIFDMPFSSDIYSYSHMKHHRMPPEGHHSLVGIGSNFPFDVVILINEDKDTTIRRVMTRNANIADNQYGEDKKDLEIEDFSYLDEHIADFKEYQEVWLNRFICDNPNITILRIDHLPDVNSKEYLELINQLSEKIRKVRE